MIIINSTKIKIFYQTTAIRIQLIKITQLFRWHRKPLQNKTNKLKVLIISLIILITCHKKTNRNLKDHQIHQEIY